MIGSRRLIAGLFLSLLAAGVCSAQPNAPKPLGPIPSANQLRWQNMEFYAFVHLSVNTFTDQEWGTGEEDPKIFNPDKLDCRQWARIAKEAGMKGIVITAKHHSGFCLWPSKYTEYSVKNCPWRGGKGDIVGELANLAGFRYRPDQHPTSGIITDYEFYTSTDTAQWTLVDKGEFSNIRNNPVLQVKTFPPVRGRYVRLRALRNTHSGAAAGYGEFDVITADSASQDLAANEPGIREKININREWKFRLGDFKDADKTDYNDSSWSNVHLPHNFSIPYFRSPQWYTGYGWYRKHLAIPAAWKDKRIFLEFEGAFREAEIFVNGRPAGTHHGGYTGFSLDISRLLKPGENIVAVRLTNRWNARLAPRNGDHNFTGGIYRDVYLVKTSDVHVTWYGTRVTTPKLSRKSGTVDIETEVQNDGRVSKAYTLRTAIVGPSGQEITTVSSRQIIAAGGLVVFRQSTMPIKSPQLWSPQHPVLYKALSTVWDGKKLLDSYETTFGFRWMRWTADSGFFLNGEHYYFHGADVHQDHAGWASAVTNAGIERDVKMVKDCGMDFIRGSHYPHDPAFSDACDSLGVLLWEENDFWGSGGDEKEADNWYSGAGAYPINKADEPYFDESVRSDLRDMIRIHRNHPSIIVWSLCNEPFFTDGSTIGRVRSFLKELTGYAHELDPTRPVGIGGCQRGGIDTCGDVAGYNGDGARLFINPGIPNLVTEYGSTIARRPGAYAPGWGDLQQDAFAWRSGQALWCAFDYGTRAGDFGLMGMIDYFRLPKNSWYWYRNAYRHIPPPDPARKGVAAKVCLSADKTVITGTNGTDDIKLMVTILDKDGHPLSNSPDVTLRIVSGPGEFPTGNSITFNDSSDIYIRDGKAAIEFRSYYGGPTVIEASSAGLQGDSIRIQTTGLPLYIPGVTPTVQSRPYIRYSMVSAPVSAPTGVNIAAQKPTRASSELPGRTANLANDRDTTSFWEPAQGDTAIWWEADLENLYTVSGVRVHFGGDAACGFAISLSQDRQHWVSLGRYTAGSEGVVVTADKTTGRFLRITFMDRGRRPVAVKDVEVYGKVIDHL